MIEFSTIFDRLLTFGMNKHDSPDNISEGYVEDATNVDVEAATLRGRTGFERFSGDIPLRVEEMTITNSGAHDSLVITLPDYVDLSALTPGPIEIKGRYINESSVATTANWRYSSYLVGSYTVLSSSATTASILAAASKISSVATLFGLRTTNGDYEVFDVGSVDIHSGTFNITLTYSTPADITCYYYSYVAPAGYSYMPVVGIAPATSITVTTATHSLPNINIIPMLLEDVGGSLLRMIKPNNFIVDTATSAGDVTITFAPAPAGNVYPLLVAAPTANSVYGTTSSTGGSTIVNIPNAETPFIFAACYLDNSSYNELVNPDSIEYDPVSNSHNITFTIAIVGAPINYQIVYVYGTARQNVMTIPDAGAIAGGNLTTTSLAMAVYGIDQDLLPVKTTVNYIDSYLDGDEVVIAADGLLYKSDDGVAATATFNNQGRVDSDGAIERIVGPVFTNVNGGTANNRTDGSIYSAAGVTDTGYVTVTSVTFVSGNSVKYRLNVTGYGVIDKNGAASATTLSALLVGRYLTVIRIPNGKLNGSFEITAVSAIDANHIDVTVTNTNVSSGINNTLQSGGVAGCFTDVVYLTPTAAHWPNNDKTGGLFMLNTSYTLPIVDVDTTGIFVDPVPTKIKLTPGRQTGVTFSDTDFSLVSSTLLTGDSIVTYTDANGTTDTNRISELTATSFTLREAATVNEGILTISLPRRWSVILPADDKLGIDFVDREEPQRSVPSRGSLYLASGLKYNGTKSYRSGLPAIQPQLFVSVLEDGGGIPVVAEYTDITGGSGTDTLTVTTPTMFAVGDRVLLRDTSVGAVVSVNPKDVYLIENVAAATVTVDHTLTIAGASGELAKFTEYEYFLRWNILDSNGNTIVTPSAGSKDIRVRLTAPAKVHLRGLLFPSGAENIEYDKLNLEIFRRNNNNLATDSNYYKVGVVPVTGKTGGYIDFVDSVADFTLSANDRDILIDPLSGGIGETRTRAPAASCTTIIANQLVYGNLTGEKELTLGLYGTPTEASFQVKSWTVVHSAGSKVFQPVTTSTVLKSATAGVGKFTVVCTGAVPAGVVAGSSWVYIANNLPNALNATSTILGWYLVESRGTSGGDTTLTLTWPDCPASLTATDDNNLTLFYIESTTIIPLAGTIAYYNLGQSVSLGTEIVDMFGYHLASAINHQLNSLGIYARAGRDFTRGYVRIFGDTLTSVTIPASLPTNLSLFGNGVHIIAGGASVTAARKSYPSRLTMSLPGFPEVFQDVDVDSNQTLPTTIDINPDDGEPITGIIPFFASSAYGQAQQTDVLVIFKPHSVYVLYPQALYYGQADKLKKLATRGLGCEATGSITNSNEGVYFANAAGIFFLDKSFMVNFVGHKLERVWTQTLVDSTRLPRMCASNYIIDRKYRLSVALDSDSSYTDTVYSIKYGEDNSNEYGGWTSYTGIRATGWATKGVTTFFASDRGYVGEMLNFGNRSAHHDAGEPITMSVTFRAMDFGMPSLRKVVKFVTLFLESTSDATLGEIALYGATDLSNNFELLDTYVLRGNESDLISGIGDMERNKISRAAFSPTKSRVTYLQLKLVATLLRKDLTITRVAYRVGLLRTRGEEQASQTK